MATEMAVVGGGCFWCIDAAFREMPGVGRVESGYAGGWVDHPTYDQVCGKKTGHAEVVKVEFDTDQISYREILEAFFALHDPTTRDRQGADIGPQYRSIVLTTTADQEVWVRTLIEEMEAAKIWNGPITTEVAPLKTFWPAEEEHQDYYKKHPWNGYCMLVISPKLAKFRQRSAKAVS